MLWELSGPSLPPWGSRTREGTEGRPRDTRCVSRRPHPTSRRPATAPSAAWLTWASGPTSQQGSSDQNLPTRNLHYDSVQSTEGSGTKLLLVPPVLRTLQDSENNQIQVLLTTSTQMSQNKGPPPSISSKHAGDYNLTVTGLALGVDELGVRDEGGEPGFCPTPVTCIRLACAHTQGDRAAAGHRE